MATSSIFTSVIINTEKEAKELITALENAEKICNLNEKEKDIIVKHMWPVTLLSFPKYKESFLITIFDKRSALKSFFEYNKKQFSNTKFYRYAYIFFTGLLFRIF